MTRFSLMIAKKTTKEDFDKTVTLITPKRKDTMDLQQLTTGEIVSLWWISHHKTGVYIPKYFKSIYAIDIVKQTKTFKKSGYITEQETHNNLTEKGQNLLNINDWIIKSHINNVGPFNSERRLLSQMDISTAESIGSGFATPNNEVLPSEFISLDIETTGVEPKNGDSIIQLSATHVLNGIEVDYFDTHISSTNSLSDFTQKLTGITNEDLKNAPSLKQVTTEFINFVDRLPIIGWNIKQFDIPFLSHYGITFPDNPIIDLMYLSRRYNHGGVNSTLTTLKRMTGIKALAHNSLSDSRSTVLVGKLITQFKLKSNSRQAISSNSPSLADFKYDDDSPIFEGIRFVFTGSVEDGKYTRPQMEYIVKKHGGIVSSSLSKNVTYFIKGIQTAANLKDGKHSTKELKYLALRDQGVDIYQTNGQGFDQLLAEYKLTSLL